MIDSRTGSRRKLRGMLFSALALEMLAPANARASAYEREVERSADGYSSAEDQSEIIVLGKRSDPLAGLTNDDALDEGDIEAYGFDTVGELISEVSDQVGPSRLSPVVLIDGRLASGINDIRNLPVEAVEKVEVFGSAAAVRLGQSPSRPVVNVSLKSKLLQWTGNVSGTLATIGGYTQAGGSQSRFYLRNGNRDLLGVEGRSGSAIDESERSLVPLNGGQGGLTNFRTLKPAEDMYVANASLARNFTENFNLAMALRYEREFTNGRNGSAFIHMIDPLGVESSKLLGVPLTDHASSKTLSSGLTANAILGAWQASLLGQGNFHWSNRIAQTEFNPDSAGGLEAKANRSSDSSLAIDIQIIATGPILSLPSGTVMLTAKTEWQNDFFRARFDGLGEETIRSIGRRSGRAAATITTPLVTKGHFPGALDLDLASSLRHITDFGSVFEYGAGLNWVPSEALRLELRFAEEREPPAASYISDAPVVLPNYTIFDFLRNETVSVDYIVGGNQSLPVERSREFSALLRFQPVPRTNFIVQYTRSKFLNSASSLPPINAEVQAAFPDRFLRDSSGRLVLVDARSIAFYAERDDTLQFGLDLRRNFAAANVERDVGITDDGPTETRVRNGQLRSGSRGLRLNLRINYRLSLRNERQARRGLPIVDLLDGGAPGYGSGAARHRLDFSAGLAGQGLGLQVEGAWRGKSTIRSGMQAGLGDLKFRSRAGINVRSFANLPALLSGMDWVRGARLTLSIENLFDVRQRVTDSSGTVPLGYQPALLDPLGRTMRLALRKIF